MQGLFQLKNSWLHKHDSPAFEVGKREGGGERENVSEYGGFCDGGGGGGGGGGSSIKVCYSGGP